MSLFRKFQWTTVIFATWPAIQHLLQHGFCKDTPLSTYPISDEKLSRLTFTIKNACWRTPEPWRPLTKTGRWSLSARFISDVQKYWSVSNKYTQGKNRLALSEILMRDGLNIVRGKPWSWMGLKGFCNPCCNFNGVILQLPSLDDLNTTPYSMICFDFCFVK